MVICLLYVFWKVSSGRSFSCGCSDAVFCCRIRYFLRWVKPESLLCAGTQELTENMRLLWSPLQNCCPSSLHFFFPLFPSLFDVELNMNWYLHIYTTGMSSLCFAVCGGGFHAGPGFISSSELSFCLCPCSGKEINKKRGESQTVL